MPGACGPVKIEAGCGRSDRAPGNRGRGALVSGASGGCSFGQLELETHKRRTIKANYGG